MDKQGEYKMNLHITMNGESIHKYIGDKVNQQIEDKKLTCNNGKCPVYDILGNMEGLFPDINESEHVNYEYKERPEWAWLVENE